MDKIEKINQIIAYGISHPTILLEIFDQAETVSCDFMIGRWCGQEIKTGHPIEGLLEQSKWYGKLFIDTEHVFPLVFQDQKNQSLFATDPKYVPLNHLIAMIQKIGKLLPIATKILKTKSSKARLRMVEFRGKSSATMIYDEKPINDHFRKIDENRVLGIMDMKGVSQFYFFILERDDHSKYHLDI